MGQILSLLMEWVGKIIDFAKWVMRMLGGPSRPAPAPRRRPARERRGRREPVVDAVSDAADDAEDDDVDAASDVA